MSTSPESTTLPEVIAAIDAVDRAATGSGATIGVVIDVNGSAPGGIAVERVTVAPSQVDSTVDRLDALPGVVSAAPEQLARPFGDPLHGEQWSHAATRLATADTALTGDGILVAVVDSGVNGGHPDFDGRVLPGTSFLSGDPANGQAGNNDPNGHGTHVAGIIGAGRNTIGVEGVAPSARILPVRVLRASGVGYSSDIAAGIRWAFQQGADIINVSLGNQGAMPPDVGAAIDAVTTDTGRGKAPAIVVAAAGNFGSTVEVWPASSAPAIAVGALTPNGDVAGFTSTGPALDVVAPGQSIASTCNTSGYCLMSGTSMASPFIAGTLALARQLQPSLDANGAQALLASTSVDLGQPGRDDASGVGLVDVARLLGVGTVARVPAPPRLNEPTCAADACSLTVGAPLVDGGSPLTATVVELLRGDAVVASQPIDGPVRLRIDGLAAATTYTWRLRSTNAVGVSADRVLRVATTQPDGTPVEPEPLTPIPPPPTAAPTPPPTAPPVSAAQAPKKKPKSKPKSKKRKARSTAATINPAEARPLRSASPR
jgi:subtilisin family serine protease